MNGKIIIRIGIALIFIWGGLEKFIPGFFGGPGLEGATGFVGGVFGVEGTLATIMTIGLAVTELAIGILLITGKKLFETYAVSTLIMLVALIMVWFPAAFKDMSGANNVTWVTTIIHVGLFVILLGLTLDHKKKS